MTDGREIIVARRRLGEHCRDLLVAQGLSTGDALTVADSLVSAECRGTVSHGVARLPHYLERLRRGSIQARPAITVAREFGATMLLDGGDGLGQVVNQRAVTEVTRLTRDHGCGWVSIRRNSHCGAMAYYGLQIAREEMVAIVFTHSDSLVLPHGARQKYQGTNPICVAAPGEGDEVFCLDMATSAVPWNRVMNARQRGDSIPAGVAVDAAGRDTTDPHRAVALHAAGGHRGSGLGLAIDMLCSMLGGAPFGIHIPIMYGDLDSPRELGGLVGAIDIRAFAEPAEFRRRVSAWMAEIRALPADDHSPRVLAPGDPEATADMANSQSLAIPPTTLAALNAEASRAGLPPLAACE